MLTKAVAYCLLAFLCCICCGLLAFQLLLSCRNGFWALPALLLMDASLYAASRDQLSGLLEKSGWRDGIPMVELPQVLGRIVLVVVAWGSGRAIGYWVATIGLRGLLRSKPDLQELLERITNSTDGTIVAAICGLIAAIVAGYAAWYFAVHPLMGGSVNVLFLRGRRLLNLKNIIKSIMALNISGPTVFWGGVDVPRRMIVGLSLCFVGAPGAGKTLQIKRYMGATLKEVKDGSDQRAVVYDFKGDLLPILHSITGGRALTLNAFDLRCISWRIAADIDTVALTNQFSTTLVPVEHGPNRFFSDAVRHILGLTTQALMKKLPRRWTLRDILLALEEPHYLRQLLSQFPETRCGLQYFSAETTFQNIQSSIQATLFPYAPIAACWHRAKRSIALSEWIREAWVLHLGAAESIRFQQDTLNRLIIQRVSELTLSQTESSTRGTSLWVDELRMLGKAELVRFLTGARSKGGWAVLGFQDCDGIKEVFGQYAPDELAGLCPGKVLLRMDSASTAKWAAELVGSSEWMDYRRSNVDGQTLVGGQSGEQRSERLLILPSEFMSFPPTTPENGLTGVFLHPSIGAFKNTIPWSELMSEMPCPTPQVPEFVERPKEHQYLEPWSAAELAALGLNPVVDSQAPPAGPRIVGKPRPPFKS